METRAASRAKASLHQPTLRSWKGDIGIATTAEKIAQTAIEKFGSIDNVVSSAGIFSVKPFSTDYTIEEFRRFVSTNIEGFIFITQRAVKQMLAQGTGGSVTCITAALTANPIAGIPALHSNDHQGRIGRGYPEPSERICEKQHPV